MHVLDIVDKICPMRLLEDKCIGEKCMLWRWNKIGTGDILSYSLYSNGETKEILYEKYIDSENDGYCGLAGKE